MVSGKWIVGIIVIIIIIITSPVSRFIDDMLIFLCCIVRLKSFFSILYFGVCSKVDDENDIMILWRCGDSDGVCDVADRASPIFSSAGYLPQYRQDYVMYLNVILPSTQTQTHTHQFHIVILTPSSSLSTITTIYAFSLFFHEAV